MVSSRVRARNRYRACAAGILAGACAAALSVAACISPPPQPTTPNEIQYQGPQSVPGPSGTFSFSFTKTSGGTPQISVAAPQGMVCTLVGTTQVTYARSRGFVSSRSYCSLTAVSDDGGQYIRQSRTVTVNVSAASATASASPAGPAVNPTAPAPQAAPAAPSPTPAPSRPTSAISSTTPSSDGGREFTPSTQAATTGDGAITYSIGSPSSSACHLRAGRIVVVGQNGSCTVIATAAATSKYSAASTSVTFNISNYTDPNQAPATSAPVI